MVLFCAPSSLQHESPLETLIDYVKRELNESADANVVIRAKYLGLFIADDSDDEDSRQRSYWPEPLMQLFGGKGDDIIRVPRRKPSLPVSYEQLIASRSMTAPGRATKSYYGIEIHRLMEEARDTRSKDKRSHNVPKLHQSVESPSGYQAQAGRNTLWTEKYRARRFKDLIGDDRTHRAVLRWLKGWDPIVFPSLAKSKAQNKTADLEEPNTHRKILLLTGPPGLGKTTLAHVCAKQAGYEVLEINASDERSRDVVKGRIKDAVGTENVKSVSVIADGRQIRKPGRPVCVVVDEVDGVVGGSGGGEGGFMKALIDLVTLDQKNSKRSPTDSTNNTKKKKGDKFRLMRPLILICNDVYHPSLRPLRTSSIAEIIHVRQVPLDQVVQRMKHVFEKEGISCDGDAVRRICEASWGLSATRDRQVKSRGISEGDIRGVLVAGEWIARKLRYAGSLSSNMRLTRAWVEQHILGESSKDGSIPGLGRGGTKEIVERVFLEGAGFSYDRVGNKSFKDPYGTNSDTITPVGVADLRKRHAINRLTEMVDATGEYDRCVADCFLTYPTKAYQDDTFLSKPNAAYEWLHFHDLATSRMYANQDWELNKYLSQTVIAFHHLFSSPNRANLAERKSEKSEEEHPFLSPRADYTAFEIEKQNRAILTEFKSTLSAPLLRIFLSPGTIATELVPNLMRMLAPEIKPVIVGGSGSERGIASVRKESERALVQSAVRVMNGLGVTFERTRVEVESGAHGGWVYRMEPALDSLASFFNTKGTSMASAGSSAPVRYAVRQVLDQEYRKDLLKRQAQSRQDRYDNPRSLASKRSNNTEQSKENQGSDAKSSRLTGPKRDFFGRVIVNSESLPSRSTEEGKNQKLDGQKQRDEKKVWVSYHEGFSNAVRKRITMHELMSGF
ncbi:conserved hypothetical protein [Uncinocarpus reesii 1704]|uniref:AAA+ ATPase domain-containing protein n=1 Tax=Uncinocarpus reesii (strain UAMH 1704) TaxID=336963 RepID=C4JXJ4_UNCRE|nr:uncharacterized protein UREG_06367 [Uncinocarpus reesii 1704]EEP81502.1 conserved hypothetical protein [Uncinocarpus reesii 1704]